MQTAGRVRFDIHIVPTRNLPIKKIIDEVNFFFLLDLRTMLMMEKLKM